jgi:hypothetical protein
VVPVWPLEKKEYSFGTMATLPLNSLLNPFSIQHKMESVDPPEAMDCSICVRV